MEERRTVHRYKIPVAVEVRCRSKAMEPEFIHGKTRDVSTAGLYLKSNQRLAVGTRIALSLTLPTNGIGAVVDCKAKVVRVEETPDAMIGRFGIAVVIDSYNFVRPKSAT
jgi:c-di-GMP-binding flagellar brake protein YcgR